MTTTILNAFGLSSCTAFGTSHALELQRMAGRLISRKKTSVFFFLTKILLKSVKYFQQTFWNEVDFCEGRWMVRWKDIGGVRDAAFPCFSHACYQLPFITSHAYLRHAPRRRVWMGAALAAARKFIEVPTSSNGERRGGWKWSKQRRGFTVQSWSCTKQSPWSWFINVYQMNIMTVRMNKFAWKQVWWSNDFTTARWSFHNRCL